MSCVKYINDVINSDICCFNSLESIDGNFKFVELDNKLYKVMPNKRKCSHQYEFTLHLRFKFYVDASNLRYCVFTSIIWHLI